MKYLAIGDIHGRIHKLHKLLDEFTEELEDPDVKVVFLGDYVDRGKRSREVLTLVKHMVEEGKAIAIQGNHDYMLTLVYPKLYPGQYTKMQLASWKENYAKTAINSYYTFHGLDDKLLMEHIAFIKTMSRYHLTQTFAFNHSGDDQDPIWGRTYGADPKFMGLLNVHGHSPNEEPFIGMNSINLDTGAAWGPEGRLTGALLAEGSVKPLKIVSVH